MTLATPIAGAVRLALRQPWLVIIVTLAATLLAGTYAARNFALTTDTSALISPDVDWRRDEAAFKAAFPGLIDTLIVIVDAATPEGAEGATARLTTALKADDTHFIRVRRPDGGTYFDRHGLLFRSPEEVEDSTAALIEAGPLLGPLAADPSLRGIADTLALAAEGAARGEGDADRLARPFGRIEAALAAALAGERAAFSWQALIAAEDALPAPTRRLILVEPRLDFGALKPAAEATAAIEEAAASLDPAAGTTVRITGGLALADEEFSSLEENIGFVGLVMLAAMLATLWFAVRSVRMVAAITVMIVSGLVVTTAIGLMAVGALNLISLAFIPLFVGLGVDFGIQLSVRLNAERRDGADVQTGLTRAAGALGAQLALAGAALFLGFGAFLPTEYVGISELGIISGLGILVALGLTVTMLPALILILAPPPPTGRIGFAWAAPVDRWLERRRTAILWAFGIAMIGSIALLPFVRFDFNPLNLRDPEAPAMQALADLMQDPLRTPNTVQILAADADAAATLARRLRDLPEVVSAVSADDFVPTDQDAKLPAIEDAALILDFTLNPFDIAPPPSDAETVAALRDLAAALETLDSADAARLATTAGRLAEAEPDARSRAAVALVPPLEVTLGGARAALTAERVTRADLPPDIARDWLTAD
ncbi:MAG: MMPL family transporter, partial [Pseudomonadota bacterium]